MPCTGKVGHKKMTFSATTLKIYILTSVTLLLTACVVNIPTQYYSPSALEGEIVRALQPRTNSAILFNRQNTIIGLNTSTDNNNDLYATISFEIPDDTQVKLLDHHLTITPYSKESWSSPLSGKVWTGPGRTKEFPPEGIMTGGSSAWRFGTAKGFGQTQNSAYFFEAFLFKMAQENSFQITMPRFMLNNTELSLPSVVFTLAKENLWTSLP